MAEQRKLILPLGGYRSWVVETAAALRSAELLHPLTTSISKRVVLPYSREATALVWIVSKLLMEIGLEPVHEMTQSSAIDLARVSDCKLVIGFASKVDALDERLRGGYADLLQRWFATPIVWTCFESPSMTTASLRAITKRFDRRVARRVDAAIVKGEALVAQTDRALPASARGEACSVLSADDRGRSSSPIVFSGSASVTHPAGQARPESSAPRA